MRISLEQKPLEMVEFRLLFIHPIFCVCANPPHLDICFFFSVVLFSAAFYFLHFFPCWLFFVLEIIAAFSKITKIETHNNTRQIRTDCPLLLLCWNKFAFINKYGLRRECQTKKKVQCFHFGPLAAAAAVAAVRLTYGCVYVCVCAIVCVCLEFFFLSILFVLLLYSFSYTNDIIFEWMPKIRFAPWQLMSRMLFKNMNKIEQMKRSWETHSSTFIRFLSQAVVQFIPNMSWVCFISSLHLYITVRLHFEFEFEHQFDISLSYKPESDRPTDKTDGTACACVMCACECVRDFDSFQIKSNMIAKFKEICLIKNFCSK